MTIFWPLSRQQVHDANGRPRLDVTVAFFAAGASDPLTVFTNPERTVAHPAVIPMDGFGRFPRIYLPDGLYKERVVSGADGLLWADDGLGLPVAAPGTTDPTPAPDQTAYAGTGDVKWRLDGSIVPGWVRMNARTIGNAASGASERANADTAALFAYLFQTFADDVASVIGGRGTSAAADFAAGKQLILPTMQGLVAGGLDDMGNTAANRLQVSTSLTLTAGSDTATVASAARIALGMKILATGVAAGTVVTGVDGTTIKMSNPAGAGSTGTVAARFSIFGDAQSPGKIGADSVGAVSNANLPLALPAGSVTVSYPPHKYVRSNEGNQGASSGAGGTGVLVNAGGSEQQTTPPADKAHTITTANPGGGIPISTLQPTRLGTFYLKL